MSESLIQDYAEFSGMTLEAVEAALGDSMRLELQEWETMNPQTPEEIERYYKRAENYLLSLVKWNLDPGKMMMRRGLVEQCQRFGLRRVLDFGCGTGEDGLACFSEGMAVVFCDLEGGLLDFVRFRAKKRNSEQMQIFSVEDLPADLKVDGIFLLDVLEHVPDPFSLIEKLARHLAPHGILLIEPRFERDARHPQHLQENVQYAGDRFYLEMDQRGYQLRNRLDEPKVFIKSARQEIIEGMVTVVIPTYNRTRWLGQAIDSVVSQDYPHIEVIVVNDGGTDEAEAVVAPYQKRDYGPDKNRVVCYDYKDNGGSASALNLGLLKSRGEFWARLDDDDLLLSGAISARVAALQGDPEAEVVVSPVMVMDEAGQDLYLWGKVDFSDFGLATSLVMQCPWSSPVGLYRRSLFARVGNFDDTSKVVADDYEMWVRASAYSKFVFLPQPTAKYRKYQQSMSGSMDPERQNLMRREIYRFLRKFLLRINPAILIPGELKVPAWVYCLRGALLYGRASDAATAASQFREAQKRLEADDDVAVGMLAMWTALLLVSRQSKAEDIETCLAKIAPDGALGRLKEGLVGEYKQENPKLGTIYRQMVENTIKLAKGESL